MWLCYWGQAPKTTPLESGWGGWQKEELYLDSCSGLICHFERQLQSLVCEWGEWKRNAHEPQFQEQKLQPNSSLRLFLHSENCDREWNQHLCERNACRNLLMQMFSNPNSTLYGKLGKVIYHDRIGDVFPRNPASAAQLRLMVHLQHIW